jgi:hypothetical protein
MGQSARHLHAVCRSTRQGGAEVPLPPYDTLRDLRLRECWLTADAAANLAVVAGRLRVLHMSQ